MNSQETSDRELLELAAKAAELPDARWDEDYQAISYNAGNGIKDCPWNPLNNVSEAFHLAVEMHIGHDCFVDGDLMENCCAWVNHRSVSGFHRVYEPYGADPVAATQRAIVKVAASIGRQA